MTAAELDLPAFNAMMAEGEKMVHAILYPKAIEVYSKVPPCHKSSSFFFSPFFLLFSIPRLSFFIRCVGT